MIRAEEEEERRWEVQEMKAGWAAQDADAAAKDRARRLRQQQLQADVEVFNRYCSVLCEVWGLFPRPLMIECVAGDMAIHDTFSLFLVCVWVK